MNIFLKEKNTIYIFIYLFAYIIMKQLTSFTTQLINKIYFEKFFILYTRNSKTIFQFSRIIYKGYDFPRKFIIIIKNSKTVELSLKEELPMIEHSLQENFLYKFSRVRNFSARCFAKF